MRGYESTASRRIELDWACPPKDMAPFWVLVVDSLQLGKWQIANLAGVSFLRLWRSEVSENEKPCSA